MQHWYVPQNAYIWAPAIVLRQLLADFRLFWVHVIYTFKFGGR